MKRKINRLIWVIGCLMLTLMVPVMAAAPGDVLYEREDQSEIMAFPPSIFPHWRHRIQYRCDACHDSLFEMKTGGTAVTMDLMKEGKVCGTCHNGEIAFDDSFSNCSRCHRAPED
jgi:c(7)-type cytochrome triheme protein